MQLRFIERRIPDSCRVEKVLQYYDLLPYRRGLPPTYEWQDIPTEKLPVEPRESDKVGPL